MLRLVIEWSWSHDKVDGVAKKLADALKKWRSIAHVGDLCQTEEKIS
jgi:hypothetical protein